MQVPRGHSRRRKLILTGALMILLLIGYGFAKISSPPFAGPPSIPCHAALLRTDAIVSQLIVTNTATITNMATTEALAPYVPSGDFPRCPEGGNIRIGLGNFATACGKHGAIKQPAPPSGTPSLFESVFSLIGPVKVRSQSSRNPCIANLKLIQGSIQQWGLENRKDGGDVVDVPAASLYLHTGLFPRCPAGGKYWVTVISNPPCCTIMGHSLP